METAINTQSQNEVKDLLEEYVVSPLNAGIIETLKMLQQEMEDSDERTKEQIDGNFVSVKGRIEQLRRGLNNSIHFEGGEDVFESIINEIDDRCSDIDEVLTDISPIITNIPGTVQADIKNAEEFIHDDIEKTEAAIKKEIEEIKIKLNDLSLSVDSKVAETISSIDDSKNEIQELTQKKYKTLFAISLLFGISNFLGIISMIILYLTK